MIQSINPYNNRVIEKFVPFNPEKVDKSINLCFKSFLNWKETSLDERIFLITCLRNELIKIKIKAAECITIEIGKPINESNAEIKKCVWLCDYFIENSSNYLKDTQINIGSTKSFIRYEPIGIVFGIMPWNFPFWQVFRYVVPALIVGNGVLLKHAPNATVCAKLIKQIFNQSGFPKNLLSLLIIEENQVESVIKNSAVQAITLTGSTRAGSAVASIAGKYIKKTVLELGGSDPFIVFSDADIKLSAKNAIISRYLNNGQSCIAAKRFLIHEHVYDKFILEIKKIIQKLLVGNPMLSNTDIGPLAKKEFVDKIDQQVKQSINMGADLILGGNKISTNFYEPTILTNVNTNMPVFNEEVFGPILSILKFKDNDDIISLANKTDYGLGASIWTNNIKRGLKISSKILSGSVFINGLTRSDPRLPFGGVKKSGYGRELSHYGLLEFVNIKTIVID